MPLSIIYYLTLALYLSVGLLFLKSLLGGITIGGSARLGVLGLGLGAVLLHGGILFNNISIYGALNFSFMNSASLVAWVVATLFLFAALKKPVDNLAIIIMPLAGVIVIADWIWPGTDNPVGSRSTLLSLHIAVSLLAYSLLTLAAVQSVLLLIQERHLHRKQPGGFIRALPPMQIMESLMFQMILTGFLLLTLTLISGIFFSEETIGKPLRFTHHTVLSTVAWAVFAILLVGRWRLGWRGRTAVHWTLGGFTLLVLAYFGSKFVFEFLLRR